VTTARFFKIILVLTQNQNYFKETAVLTEHFAAAFLQLARYNPADKKLWPAQITILNNSTNNNTESVSNSTTIWQKVSNPYFVMSTEQ